MEIEFCPAQGGDPSRLLVRVNGEEIYSENSPSISDTSNYLSIQSHWGSGVSFSDITITNN